MFLPAKKAVFMLFKDDLKIILPKGTFQKYPLKTSKLLRNFLCVTYLLSCIKEMYLFSCCVFPFLCFWGFESFFQKAPHKTSLPIEEGLFCFILLFLLRQGCLLYRGHMTDPVKLLFEAHRIQGENCFLP